jgi:steroid delta-isomerase-like uncharacterized protein
MQAPVQPVLDASAMRAHVESLLDAFNAHDVDAVAAHFTDDVVWIDSAYAKPLTGIDEAKRAVRAQFTAFPDLHFPKEERDFYVTPEGTKAAVRWHMVATMKGTMDPPGFAPTGKTMDLGGACFYEFRGGKIARHTIIADYMDASQQLGLLPDDDSFGMRLAVRLQRFGARLRRR